MCSALFPMALRTLRATGKTSVSWRAQLACDCRVRLVGGGRGEGERASAARLPSQGEQRRARRGRQPDRGGGAPIRRRGAAASAASARGAPPPTCRRPLGGEGQRGAAPGRRGGPSAVGGPTTVGPARADRSAVGPARARARSDRDGGGASCRFSGSISLLDAAGGGLDTRSPPEVRRLPSAAEAVAGANGSESAYFHR